MVGFAGWGRHECRPHLSVYPEAYLDAVAEELNDRLGKTLGFRKPSEEFVRLVEEAEEAA